jgi:hypothetical protein
MVAQLAIISVLLLLNCEPMSKPFLQVRASLYISTGHHINAPQRKLFQGLKENAIGSKSKKPAAMIWI